ncbi:hypothetical protein A2331_01840 [Candidatus Falkowbacteria bacterium RIFOXYB2_FULL_34_18]|uniref:Non-canonical purine NTP pyrophosphatase n=1 Tax=Candidatus Falkowbacteria bacterium RIFOXYD2_FULL_34_120 TaxID=1798007 RepID=A0A1F5TQF1_9BACT|nr:MAG: hypothetical protein A2331_01840 [Candidatus Falkowbacteria bacterium RIFOXYB2_FULL_34_18]OGF29428.1 MAG: hypothetical protein A2500_00905 [Candidatus Falkowbacteria bacterium RIFOXYC12_FULL_34_55]OGF36741.1 MAG: hypothetical protein A2466_03215 [Candidatus Falkowbacteria bacterium RIFOXYC2_FULL_34_220]OGF38954.1 MAG: hypothetical protein A2515_05330 [Candidatus Falkowbacteria bacterium RIFOXYD12_FULL_34_57]OGF41146.1 MAG: hypothetical protein A2531_01330 [Candidatus Falkowbacteria bact
MKEIVFATSNKAKVDQINFIVQYFKFPIKIIVGKEIYGEKNNYKEIGNTVSEIAKNGAIDISKKINLPVITEDTDFRVNSLNEEPGTRAGYFLKKYGRVEILRKLNNIDNRSASINSAVAFSAPDGKNKIFLNTIKGKISKEEKFDKFPSWISPYTHHFGGGYNAIFIPNGWNKTLAEISPEESIPWSYREKNFIDVIKYILEECSM